MSGKGWHGGALDCCRRRWKSRLGLRCWQLLVLASCIQQAVDLNQQQPGMLCHGGLEDAQPLSGLVKDCGPCTLPDDGIMSPEAHVMPFPHCFAEVTKKPDHEGGVDVLKQPDIPEEVAVVVQRVQEHCIL